MQHTVDTVNLPEHSDPQKRYVRISALLLPCPQGRRKESLTWEGDSDRMWRLNWGCNNTICTGEHEIFHGRDAMLNVYQPKEARDV